MSCKDCGLYRGCAAPKMRDVSFLPEKSLGTILVVGSYPSAEEDVANEYFVGSSSILKDMLQGLTDSDIGWVYTTALRCYPGYDSEGKWLAPTIDHLGNCQDEYLLETFQAREYSAIIWLGMQAMQTLYGEDAPKSIMAAKSLGAYKLEGIPLLGTYSPSAYNLQKYNLIAEYVNIFTKAIAITKGEVVDVPFTYEEIPTGTLGVYDIPKSAITLFVDAEVEETDYLPGKLTYKHPDSKLICIGLSWREPSNEYRNIVIYPDEDGLDLFLKRIFLGRSVFAHNTKYDFGVIRKFLGVDVYAYASETGDTYLDFYSLNIGGRGLSLGALASKYLDAGDWKSIVWQYIEAARKARGYGTFSDIPKPVLTKYNAEDGFWTARLYHEVLARLLPKDEVSIWNRELLRDLTEVLIDAELRGWRIDEEMRLQVTRECLEREKEVSAALYAHPAVRVVERGFIQEGPNPWGIKPQEIKEDGGHFYSPSKMNTKSPLFLTKLAIYIENHTGEKGDSGVNLSFTEDILKVLAGLMPEVPNPNENQQLWRLILENRKLRDLNSKFLVSLPKYIINGRLTYSFRLASTVTGRLSCADFNIQQISKGSDIRKMFIASPGYVLVSLDYDRIELVVLAFLAQEPRMLEGIRNREDLHEVTAALIPGATREIGKTVNFLTVYGGGAGALAAKTGVSVDEAAKFIRIFKEKFPNIEKYFYTLDQQANEGCITTLTGRRREFSFSDSQTQWRNFPVQSLASDITCAAAVRIFKAFKATKWRDHCRILALIHDDIVFEVSASHVMKLAPLLKASMEDVRSLPFKMEPGLLSAGISIGDNWKEMVEYEMRGGKLCVKPKKTT